MARWKLARPEMERLQQRIRTQLNDPAAAETYQRDIAAIWAKYVTVVCIDRKVANPPHL